MFGGLILVNDRAISRLFINGYLVLPNTHFFYVQVDQSICAMVIVFVSQLVPPYGGGSTKVYEFNRA